MTKKETHNALELAFKKAVEDKTTNKKAGIKSVMFDKSKSEVKRIQIQSTKDESKKTIRNVRAGKGDNVDVVG